MSDSSSFTSLLALVDSHLSKTNVQGSRSQDTNSVTNRFPIPSLTTALSDTRMILSSGDKLPIPNQNENSIKNVLAEQIANMLKAKELKKKQEEEKKMMEEEMKRLKIEESENDCVIDLMQALQTPYRPEPQVQLQEALSSSSSYESLFEPIFMNCDEESVTATPEPLLPCITDMSSILQQNICHAKCSAFGNILTSRMKPNAAPYFREKNETDITRFDFKTKSPCDLIKEKLRKPTSYNTYNYDIMNFI